MAQEERYVATEAFVALLWQRFQEFLTSGDARGERARADGLGENNLCEGCANSQAVVSGTSMVEMDGTSMGEIGGKAMGEMSGMAVGERHGWLNAQDGLEAKKPIHRSAVARILHEFMRRELGEQDERSIAAAKVLKDLYDCRTCVNHVAQVYCKGIMEPIREGVFGMGEGLVFSEADIIICRALWKDGRRRLEGKMDFEAEAEIGESPDFARVNFAGGLTDLGGSGIGRVRGESKLGEETSVASHASLLTKDMALTLLEEHPDCRHIDVRTAWEYANGHPDGAVNIPLLQLMEHPEVACDTREGLILLGCDGGYRSEMAARRLLEAGYVRVFHYAWDEN